MKFKVASQWSAGPLEAAIRAGLVVPDDEDAVAMANRLLNWSECDPTPEGGSASVEGGVVWHERRKGGMVAFDASWGGLRCRLVEEPEVLVRFEGFRDAHDAKLFAESCLRARFEDVVKRGEARPM